MKYHPKLHHRRSIRLYGYDYTEPGAYFVTICTQKRKSLLGYIENGKMILNNVGKMIVDWYYELENKFSVVCCDAFVCMPNHVHFIVFIVGADLCVCPKSGRRFVCSKNNIRRLGESINLGECMDSPLQNDTKRGISVGSGERLSLSKVVQWFKTMTTNNYLKDRRNSEGENFFEKLWQRNYYEHIIRNEKELNGIREYIRNNPVEWQLDYENLDRIKDYKDVTSYFKDKLK